MKIAAPKTHLFCEYSTKNIDEVGDDKHSVISRLIFNREILLPKPFGCRDRPFYNGHDYLVAAFHYADLPNTTVVETLAVLTITLV